MVLVFDAGFMSDGIFPVSEVGCHVHTLSKCPIIDPVLNYFSVAGWADEHYCVALPHSSHEESRSDVISASISMANRSGEIQLMIGGGVREGAGGDPSGPSEGARGPASGPDTRQHQHPSGHVHSQLANQTDGCRPGRSTRRQRQGGGRHDDRHEHTHREASHPPPRPEPRPRSRRRPEAPHHVELGSGTEGMTERGTRDERSPAAGRSARFCSGVPQRHRGVKEDF